MHCGLEIGFCTVANLNGDDPVMTSGLLVEPVRLNDSLKH